MIQDGIIPADTVIAKRYRIREARGRVGVGALYRVVDQELDRELALELFDRGALDDSETYQRVNRAIDIARGVVHRNLCRIHELGAHEDRHFLTANLIAGETLAARLERTLPPPEDGAAGAGAEEADECRSVDWCIEVIRDVLAALAAAHSSWVAHGNLTPHYVLLRDADGGAVVVDLAVANALAQGARGTGDTGDSGASDRDEDWLWPPERELSALADARSDVYALGVLAYHLLTGELPDVSYTTKAAVVAPQELSSITGSTMASRRELRAIVTVDQMPPGGERLAEFINLCLQPDPAHRPHDAVVAVRLFERAVAGMPIEPDELEDGASGTGALSRGSVIAGKFEVEGLAGAGGMGAVYRAVNRETGAPVALKLVRGISQEQRAQRRFEREAQILADLEHPGIVSYVAHGEADDGMQYLAMEWLDGESLEQRLRAGPIDPAASVRLVERVAEALAKVHRLGIIHRDLKPSNLFLRSGDLDRITILDFGVAFYDRAIQATRMTVTGSVIGTPLYMAPEQASGRRDVTPAADVYSLGCVLFRCLTGRPPFTAEHVTALLAKVLFEDAPRLRTLRPDLPAALDELVARMLARDPEMRPSNAADLLMSLSELTDMRGASGSPWAGETRRSKDRPGSLDGSEQRFVSVVIARRREPEQVATLHFDEEPLDEPSYDSLRASLVGYGARVERLADDSVVATLLQLHNRSATDLAARAAHCALFLHEQWGDARVVLATGRGVVDERVPTGEVIDRAGLLLRTGGEVRGDHGVVMDEMTERLLDTRYRRVALASGTFELVGEDVSADETRPLLGKPTPCVGRGRELTMLHLHLSECVEESLARVVLITAPAGMGKSRLRHEFLRQLLARGQDGDLLYDRIDEMNAGASCGLLSRALRRRCGIAADEPLAAQQAKLRAYVGEVGDGDDHGAPAPDHTVAFLGEMCGIPFADDDIPQLRAARRDPRIMSDQVMAAFIDLLRARLADNPVLMVLEDLHWGDLATVRIVDAALRELSEAPLMVLALARPEVHDVFPSLWSGRDCHEIRLQRLSKRSCRELIENVLGEGASDRTVERIIARSAGNALYLEELIRAAAEGKDDDVPDTVLAMMQARLGRLELPARHILRAGSVFGEIFWRGGVSELLGSEFSDSELDRWLRRLEDAEMLRVHRDSRFANEVQYGFRHALIRDAAHSLLTPADATLAHLLAAGYLERAGEHDPAVLAEHYRRGDELGKAAEYYAKAADQALDGNDLPAALHRAAQGVACGVEGTTLGQLRTIEAWARFWRGELPDAFVRCSDAIELLPPGGVRWCRAMGNMFMTAGLLGKKKEMMEYVALFGQTDPEDGARSEFVEAASILMTVFSLIGQRAPAESVWARIEAIGGPIAEGDPKARGWMKHGINWHLRFMEPDPWRVWVTAREGTAAFAEAGDLRMFAVEQVYLGIGEQDLGMGRDAEATLRAAMSSGESLGEQLVVRLVRCYLALLLVERAAYRPEVDGAGGDGPGGDGETAAADTEAELAEVRALAQAVVDTAAQTYYAGLAHCALAGERALARDWDEAERHARRAVEILAVAPPLRPLGYTALVEVLLARGEHGRSEPAETIAEACAVADEGIALVDEIGGSGRKELRLWWAAARARDASGDPDAARETVRRALDAVVARADAIPDPDARARFLTRVPACRGIAEIARRHLPDALPL